MTTIWETDNIPSDETLKKGVILGGSSIAALYGLKQLRDYFLDKFNLDAKVYDSDIKKIYYAYPHREDQEVELEEEEEKKSKKKSTKDSTKEASIKSKIALGMGIPIGAFGVYKLMDYLKDIEDSMRQRHLIRAIQQEQERDVLNAINDTPTYYYGAEHPLEEKENIKKKKEKLKKDAALNLFLDGLLDKETQPELLEKEAQNQDKSTLAQLWDIAGNVVSATPIVYGAIIPMGALSGYYAMKYMDKDIAKEENILNNPEIEVSYASNEKFPTTLYTFTPKQVSEMNKSKKIKKKVYKVKSE